MPNWYLLLSSATLVAACVFLVRFFGRAIADQIPFCDDRKWAIDLHGVNFFLRTILFWSVVGYAVAYHFPFPLITWWLRYAAFLIISLIVFWLVVVNYVLGQKYFDLNANVPKFLRRNEFKVALKKALETDPYLPSVFVTAFVSYVLTSIYFSGHWVWFFLAAVESFMCAFYMAIRESYHILQKLPLFTIYLSDEKKLHDVSLLKMNPTNVRIRKGKKIKIINMDIVEWLEIDREG